MSDTEPIVFRPRQRALASTGSGGGEQAAAAREPAPVTFNRLELNKILNLYGRRVAAGEWRDYALDFGREMAVFSVFRRTSEVPLYRVEKTPKLARKQGMYSVVSASGLIMKRGNELDRVLAVLDKEQRLSLV